ncbi:peptidoglycan DD-metalloendopeptidase family protein [Pedobacter psychrotolerans]|uniref:peptidoglycan DD-metalloendopeptidase family protein n=1 Tax=Pedobacter psychrotolerans TaxID=1843235 RepID=UPI003F9CC4E0
MNRLLDRILPFILLTSMILSCKSGTVNLFKAASPHEQYLRKLETSGLNKTAMGSAWIKTATLSMEKALNINIPYLETGYFASDRTPAAAYKFTATKGQKINISITKKPTNAAMLYLDLWHLPADGKIRMVASADTLNNPIQYDIEASGNYLIRLQPELLQSVQYTLEITSGPSLAFPTQSKSKNIGSFWGDGRDNNARKHEGVDIFGTFRSPVLAIAEGTITRVNENNLGGKVVWLRPKGKDYTLYYAHLDEQIAMQGQEVKTGDTIGLMGNTGNARNTPTHLHFGIYASDGATNPLPFIDPVKKTPQKIIAPLNSLNENLRTSKAVKFYRAPSPAALAENLDAATLLNIQSATGHFYKAELPDGKTGFVPSAALSKINKPLKKIKVNLAQQMVYDQPDSAAAVKKTLAAGQLVNVLGNFGNYQFISEDQVPLGWIVK